MADLELSRLLKTQEKRKLKPAPARDPIAASIGLAIPAESAGSGTSAVASPWTKVAESGSAMIVSSESSTRTLILLR